jgi:hypothetical protein
LSLLGWRVTVSAWDKPANTNTLAKQAIRATVGNRIMGIPPAVMQRKLSAAAFTTTYHIYTASAFGITFMGCIQRLLPDVLGPNASPPVLARLDGHEVRRYRVPLTLPLKNAGYPTSAVG